MVTQKGILSGEHLLNEIYSSDDILINNIDWRNYEGWQFDLNLGEEAFVTGSDEPIRLGENDHLTIKSGSFALLMTNEEIKMPSYLMGFIAVKFSYKKLGLINISGFHVDPGYKGKLIFSVYNAGPNDILMRRGKPVFSIFFQHLTQDLNKFDKEALIEKLPISKKDKSIIIKKDFKRPKGYTGIPLDMITAIHGPSKSITMYNDRIEKLEHNLKIYGTIALTISAALVGALLTIGFD
ncbi:MAG: hypothetical protein PHY90_09545 [Desulfitobacteriaceae bacterium]|nr:hypothetical protein [Desulfitobacteriaceae bacterium]